MTIKKTSNFIDMWAQKCVKFAHNVVLDGWGLGCPKRGDIYEKDYFLRTSDIIHFTAGTSYICLKNISLFAFGTNEPETFWM
jgi:hypothetical protein